MTGYTVKQLAKLAGISVRTLHHYDEIGLLKPRERSDAGYRYYGRQELLRLQQILFYKELDFSLQEIRRIMNEEDFDLLRSLQFHREELLRRSERLQQLLATIDKTIKELKNQKIMLTDKELYEGFPKGDVYRKEAAERWGEKMIIETEDRLKNLGKEGWKNLKEEAEEITRTLAGLMDHAPSRTLVQEAIARHYAHMNQFYDVNETRYRGLADMYVQDERFKDHYDKHREGLAEFVRQAIHIYCDNGMKIIT